MTVEMRKDGRTFVKSMVGLRKNQRNHVERGSKKEMSHINARLVELKKTHAYVRSALKILITKAMNGSSLLI